jgi:transcriptional regulator with XRE-family HTH domain
MLVRKGADCMDMTAGEKIKTIMQRQKVSMGEMADGTNQSRQNLSNKMKRDDFSESELRKMAAVLGCTVEVVFRDAEGNVIL